MIPGIYSLARFGLRPSIDFTGGTLLELQFSSDVPQLAIDLIAQQELPVVSIQKLPENSYFFRIKPEGSEKIGTFLIKLAKSTGGDMPAVVRQETVGPILGKELLQKTLVAAILAALGILLYVAWAFKNVRFGVAAITALVHDLLVVVGIFSLLGQLKGVEVDTLFVTAILTTMSFSVHDTIVVFDRIRELRRGNERVSLGQVADRALTETMGRSLANSFTILFMLLALVLLGGVTTKWFALALLIGTISGTYSSPFVATPVLLIWEKVKLFKSRK